MTTVKMIKLQDDFMRELRPLDRGYTRRATGPAMTVCAIRHATPISPANPTPA